MRKMISFIIILWFSISACTSQPTAINNGCWEDEAYIEWVTPSGNESKCIPVDNLPTSLEIS